MSELFSLRNACFPSLRVGLWVHTIMRVKVCVSACVASTEESTRWVCFPSVLVNRSRAAFMCWAHYHGNGCDGNLGAAQVWQATVCRHKPHVYTFFFPPSTFCLFSARTGLVSPVPTAAPPHRWKCTTTIGRSLEPCRRTASLRTEQWWSEKKREPFVCWKSDASYCLVPQRSIKSTSMSHTVALGHMLFPDHQRNAFKDPTQTEANIQHTTLPAGRRSPAPRCRRWGSCRCLRTRSSLRGSSWRWSRWKAASWRTRWKRWCSAQTAANAEERCGRCRCRKTSHLRCGEGRDPHIHESTHCLQNS